MTLDKPYASISIASSPPEDRCQRSASTGVIATRPIRVRSVDERCRRGSLRLRSTGRSAIGGSSGGPSCSEPGFSSGHSSSPSSRPGYCSQDNISQPEFSTCLRVLQRQLTSISDDAPQHFAARVRTYRAYDELSSFVHNRGENARRLLAERPFPFGKTLLSFASLYFLRKQFAFEVGKEFEELFAEHDTPERLAEAASAVIALANEHRRLESADFTLPLSGIDVSDDFIAVLRYGAAICVLRETGKTDFYPELRTRPRARGQPARISAPCIGLGNGVRAPARLHPRRNRKRREPAPLVAADRPASLHARRHQRSSDSFASTRGN